MEAISRHSSRPLHGKYYEKERVHGTINTILKDQEERWNITEIEDAYNYDSRLTQLIKSANKQTPVVVLIDEYDAPMLDSMNDPNCQSEVNV